MTLPLNPAKAVVTSSFRKDSIAATSFFLLVDLDNASGLYRHSAGAGVKLIGAHGTLLKSQAVDKFVTSMGVVTAVSGSSVTVAYTRLGTIGLRSSGTAQSTFDSVPYPAVIDYTVSGGVLTKIATNHIVVETIASAQVEDVSGVLRVLSPGDLIIKVAKVSGAGTVILNYTVWYFVE